MREPLVRSAEDRVVSHVRLCDEWQKIALEIKTSQPVTLWRAPVASNEAPGEAVSVAKERPLRIFLHTYIVTALNPKSIIFFVAFLPQFLNHAEPIAFQMVVFEVTFLVLATANAAAYGLMASMARKTIRKPSVQRAVNRTGGSLMIGAGLLAVGWKRAAA